MKLKNHREDVKWLKSFPEEQCASRFAKEIANRYQRLILLAEEANKLFYLGIPTDMMKQVLKDAEIGWPLSMRVGKR